MDKLKKMYNDNLDRILKAQAYLDSPDRSEEEKEKWYPQFKQLLMNQEVLMQAVGLKSGDKEVLEGFRNENL